VSTNRKIKLTAFLVEGRFKGPIPVIIRYEEEKKTIVSSKYFVMKSPELESKLNGIVMKTIYR